MFSVDYTIIHAQGSCEVLPSFSNTSSCVFPCVQVIMIECADLKNVMNYQEVEALKHTIKVHRERDE